MADLGKEIFNLGASLMRAGAPQAARPAPDPGLQGCSECGCTDIESTAWINYNTGKLVGSDPPLDTIWCPQCEFEVGVKDVDTLKPYVFVEEDELPETPTDPIEAARYK